MARNRVIKSACNLCAASCGVLVTLEKVELHARIAQDNFRNAGLDGKVEIRVGDAHDQLNRLSVKAPFDFIFIDAEKTGYLDYYAWSVDNIRIGGIIALHNVLAYGQLVDEKNQGENIERIRTFNKFVANDMRVLSTIYPAGDGTLAAIKIY